MTTLPRRATRDLRTLVSTPLALLIVLLIAGGSTALIVLFPRETAAEPTVQAIQPITDKQRSDLEKWWDVQPRVDLPIPSGSEKVLIVKFSDYMCPACRQTFEAYKGVLAKYLPDGQVRFVLKHFPLEAECNPKIQMNHYASCEAAAAVIMGRASGTGPKLEQWIFDHQADLTPDVVKKAARDVGGIQDFDARYSQALQEVKADASMGQLLGVNSTPTFYINGRKVAQAVPPQYLDALIEMELKRTK
jgi:protein-disulfide isomerase